MPNNKEWAKKKAAAGRKQCNDLKNVPCKDCKGTFPHYVMEFDHVPERGRKRMEIARMAGLGTGSPSFQRELKKCDIVCANCHKVRTHMRKIKPNSSSGKTLVS